MCQASSGSHGMYSAAIVTNKVLLMLCLRTNCLEPAMLASELKPSEDAAVLDKHALTNSFYSALLWLVPQKCSCGDFTTFQISLLYPD